MVGRRDFLRLLGVSGAALGMGGVGLGAGLGRAEAQSGKPLRLVLWPMLNGAHPSVFWPSGGSGLSAVTEPFAPYRDRMTFVRGVGVDGSFNHYAVRAIYSGQPVPDYLTPDPANPSLDQLVASHIQSTAPTSLRSLHLGARPADNINFYQLYGRSTFFFNGGRPVDYYANPVTAFDQTFTGGTTTPPPPPTTTPGRNVAAEMEIAMRSIAGSELEDLAARGRGAPAVSSHIEAHRAAIAGLAPPPDPDGDDPEQPPPMAASCDATPIPTVESLRGRLQGNEAAAYDDNVFEGVFNAQMDILSRAITCGLTRVGTLQAGSADGNVVVPVGGGLPHHNTSHGDINTFAQVQRWYADKLIRFVRSIDVADPLDPGSTVLDNTLIVWMAECLPVDHGSSEVPVVLIGGAGGGRTSSGLVNVPGATNRHLMKAIAQLFGVPNANSAPSFGDRALSEVLS